MRPSQALRNISVSPRIILSFPSFLSFLSYILPQPSVCSPHLHHLSFFPSTSHFHPLLYLFFLLSSFLIYPYIHTVHIHTYFVCLFRIFIRILVVIGVHRCKISSDVDSEAVVMIVLVIITILVLVVWMMVVVLETIMMIIQV